MDFIKAVFWLFRNPRHRSKNEVKDINEDEQNDQPANISKPLKLSLQYSLN